jgi:hypothetical protein
MPDTYSLLLEIDDTLASPSQLSSLRILTTDSRDDLYLTGQELRELIHAAVARRIAELEDRLGS